LTHDKGISEGKILGHAYKGVIEGKIAVGMVLSHSVPHDTGAFLCGRIGTQPQFPHRKEEPPMYRLEPVPYIRQGPAHNYRHSVIEIICLDFVLYGNRDNLAGGVGRIYCLGHLYKPLGKIFRLETLVYKLLLALKLSAIIIFFTFFFNNNDKGGSVMPHNKI
jgi:hypothetical protein